MKRREMPGAGVKVVSVATPHQLANRTVLSAAMRFCDVALLAVLVASARCFGDEVFGLFMFGLTLATVVVAPTLESFAPVIAKRAATGPARVGIHIGRMLPIQAVLLVGLAVCAWGGMRWAGWDLAKQHVVLVMIGALGARGVFEIFRNAIRGLGRLDVELGLLATERGLLVGGAALVLIRGGGPVALGACFVLARLVGILLGLRWIRRRGYDIPWRVTGWSREGLEAVPYGLTILSNAAYAGVGVFCLSWLWNDAVTGHYSAAYRVIEATGSFSQILGMVLLPELAIRRSIAPERVAPLARKAVAYTTLVALPLAAAFFLEARWLIGIIFGSGFGEAVNPFRLLSLGLWFVFAGEIARTVLWAVDRQRFALGVMVLALLVNIGINLWLTPSWGAGGAALAMTVSGAVVCLASWYRLQHDGISWSWSAVMIRPAAVTGTVCLILLVLRAWSWPVRLLGAGLGGLATACLTGALTLAEWDLVRAVPKQLFPVENRRKQ